MSNTIHEAIRHTQHWVSEIVIGQNFCPFAKREFERNSIRYKVVTEPDLHTQLEYIIDECRVLDDNSVIDTTLIIFVPESRKTSTYCATRFTDFLDLYELAVWQMSRSEYDGIYQLATFHPDYLFADEPDSCPSHYTNRAPYPMVHLLREESISRVLRTYKDPEQIPTDNKDKAITLGSAYFQEMLASIKMRD